MKRLLSWLLVLVMVFGLLPMSAFAVEVETENGDDDFEVGMDVLLPGYSAENPATITWTWNDAHTEATASVEVPANKTMYFEFTDNVDASMPITANGEAIEWTLGDIRMGIPHTFTLTAGEETTTYALVLTVPVGHQMNPKIIETMSWYSDEVVQAKEDSDGFFYKYIAEDDGTITLYFDAVYDDEGNALDLGTQRNIMVTNNNTYIQYDLLADGVDNYGLELIVPVSKGDEIIINTAWVQDAEGNYYPEATYSWTGNFAYPAGSEQNPIVLEWAWDDAYTTATASTTTEADGTYYSGTAGMILTVDGEEVAMDEMGVFQLNAGEHNLVLSTPVGAQANPEVIEDMNDYTDTNSLAADGSYYYIWTATEDGTVTLDVTDGANITVDKLTYTEGSEWPISTQYTLAEPEIDENWNYTGWTVAENLVIDVVAGEQLKIQVNALTDWSTWTTPAIDYTLSGDFEKAGPEIDENLKFQTIGLSFQDYIGVNFVVTKAAFGAYDSVYIESVQADAVNGDIEETIQGTNLGTAMKMFDKQVLSWSMPEMITVTLYGVKDGVVTPGQTVTTSVELLALEKIAGYITSGDTARTTALVDMLNYGATVQTTFKHNETVLPNANLGDYAQYATTETPSFNAENTTSGTGTVNVFRNAVSMQSKVEIQFAFNVDVSNYELRSTVGGVTSVIPFEAAGAVMKFGKIAVKANQFRDVFTIALYDKTTGEPVTLIYTCSVEAYAQAGLGGANNDVFIAMMKYGDAVSAI